MHSSGEEQVNYRGRKHGSEVQPCGHVCPRSAPARTSDRVRLTQSAPFVPIGISSFCYRMHWALRRRKKTRNVSSTFPCADGNANVSIARRHARACDNWMLNLQRCLAKRRRCLFRSVVAIWRTSDMRTDFVATLIYLRDRARARARATSGSLKNAHLTSR